MGMPPSDPSGMGGTPDPSVSPDFQIAEGFRVLTSRMGSLESVIVNMTTTMERSLSAQMRYQMAGQQQQFSRQVLGQVASWGGQPSWSSSAMTQVSPTGALASMANLQTFTAQQVGTWLAGMPLYGQQPGTTPAGMPSSAGAQAGAGAQAAAQAAAQATGAPAPNAPLPARQQALGGLPGWLWGGQNAAAPPGRLAALQHVGARVALSGGSGGGLLDALRHLPIIGLGADAAQTLAGFYQGQREAGRVYQEVEGGTNLEGQLERLHAMAYQLSMLGRMPSGAVAQMFGAVTAMGYNRAAYGEAGQLQNRQSALDFIYQGYCVDVETEIFTRRGWLKQDEVRSGDWALALNPMTGLAEWSEIESLYRQHVSGLMIQMENVRHSSLTTPHHRWIVRDWRGHLAWRTTETLYATDRIVLGAPGGAAQEPKYADELVELAAWFFTEGYVTGRRRKPGGGGKGRATRILDPGAWSAGGISQNVRKNTGNCARIERCLRVLAGDPGTNDRAAILRVARASRWGNAREELPYQWRITERSDGQREYLLGASLLQELRQVAPGKVPSPEFLTALTQAQLELFIRTCIDGDGHRTGISEVFSQWDEQRMRAFEFACVLAGRSVSVCKRGTEASLLSYDTVRTANGKRDCRRAVPYEGIIWCPTLKHANWMARRQGKTYFTGNTGRGMSVDQSLQTLQVASQSAIVNLQDVSNALDTLGKTAGQAGDNANVARQQYLAYFSTAIQQGAGAGAPALAGAISSMQASYGKQFAGVNFAGELSQRRQYLLAGMSGLTPAQAQYIERTNPQEYARMLAGQNMSFLTMGGLMTPEMMSSLHEMIGAAGGGRALMADPSLRDQIANRFLNTWQVKGNINQDLWAQEISAMTGVSMNPTQAFQWIVNQAAGVNEASHNATLTSPGNRHGAGPVAGRYGLARPEAARYSMSGMQGRFAGPAMTSPARTWQQVLTSHSGAAAQAYLAHSRAMGGLRSPVLESLLQNLGPSDQVRVSTRTGYRVMSLADAMKLYPDELAQGNVQFYSSAGKLLGDTSMITHGLGDPGLSVASEHAQRAGSKQGLAWGRYLRQHPGAGSGPSPAGGGHPVQVGLTQEARQLLKLLPGNYDDAAAQSRVPANPWTFQASR